MRTGWRSEGDSNWRCHENLLSTKEARDWLFFCAFVRRQPCREGVRSLFGTISVVNLNPVSPVAGGVAVFPAIRNSCISASASSQVEKKTQRRKLRSIRGRPVQIRWARSTTTRTSKLTESRTPSILTQ
jgi:hypothetical protein